MTQITIIGEIGFFLSKLKKGFMGYLRSNVNGFTGFISLNSLFTQVSFSRILLSSRPQNWVVYIQYKL